MIDLCRGVSPQDVATSFLKLLQKMRKEKWPAMKMKASKSLGWRPWSKANWRIPWIRPLLTCPPTSSHRHRDLKRSKSS